MSLHVFNNSQKLIKFISDEDLIEVVQEQELNKDDRLFVEIPKDVWRGLKEQPFYVAVNDPYERFSYHMYKINQENESIDSVEIQGIQIAFDELKAHGYIQDRRFNKATVNNVMGVIVGGTDWQVGYVDDELPSISTNFYYISKLEALSKLIELSGGEVRFRVEVSGNRVVAKRIDIYKRISRFKGKRFALGSNLIDVVKETDTSGLYTALVGRGKGEELEGEDAYGRRIQFADVEWKKSNGDPVDKPLGQNYVEIPERTSLYGYPDGQPRIGIVEFTDTEEPAELLQQTYDALVEASRPQRQFKAIVETAGDMELGETVAIITPDFRYKTRVFKVKRDFLNNYHTEVEFGDKLTQSMGSIIKDIQANVEQTRDETIDIIQTAANGKNKIFRGPTKPTSGMMEGDLWYKPIGEGEYEMYIFDGDTWGDPVITTGINNQVQAELDKAEQNIQDARDEVDGVQTDADSILVGLGVKDLPNTHYDIVDSIRTGIVGKINGLDTDLVAVEGSLNARLDDIMGAVEGVEGDFSNMADKVYVNNKVDNVKGEITNIITGIKQNPEGTILGYNAMKSTVNGNVSEIASIKQSPGSSITGYNRLTETTNMVERVIGSRNESDSVIKDRMARMIMSESIFQTEISDTIDNSIDGALGAANLFNKNQASVGAIDGSGTIVGTGTNEMYSGFIPVEPNETYRLKYTSSYTGVFSFVRVLYYNYQRQFIGQLHYSTQDKQVDQSYDMPIDARYVRMSASHLSNDLATLEFTTGGLLGDIETVKTQVTQLADSWALKITSNDELVTALNASTKGVYVKGEYITLDGNTNISGNFKVTGEMLAKDATIQNLRGQTLNFAEMNAINFNAESIATGTLRGIRVEADEGLIGGWNLEGGGLYKETPYGYTTLKPGGDVAIGIASPEHGSTTGAALQIWHDGTIRFGGLGTRIYSTIQDNLRIMSHNRIVLMADATVETDSRIIPQTNGDLNLGESTNRWAQTHANSFRTPYGAMQSFDVTSTEIWSERSLYLRPENNTIYAQGNLRPRYTSTYYLGNTDYRWVALYTRDGVNESSDERLKKNIQRIDSTLLEKAEDIKPIMYEDQNGKINFGYSAQDVQRTLTKYAYQELGIRESEVLEKFSVLEKGESYLSLRYRDVEVMKGALRDKKIEELEERIEVLENERTSA